jgi:adenylate kinase
MILILLGAPGAGKGTQGAMLSKRLDLPRIATGDILRAAVRDGTELGRKAKRYMDAGELVPDEVITGLIREALASPEAADGAVFDGYPRNVPQARTLEEVLGELDRTVDAVVVIDVPEEEIVRRVSGRRSCSQCGRVFNVFSDAPREEGVCDACGGELTQRADDTEATVRRRLEVYTESTAPLIDHFESQTGAPVHTVRGDRPIAEVQDEIVDRLGR